MDCASIFLTLIVTSRNQTPTDQAEHCVATRWREDAVPRNASACRLLAHNGHTPRRTTAWWLIPISILWPYWLDVLVQAQKVCWVVSPLQVREATRRTPWRLARLMFRLG
jgi:hypothetical protein